MNRQGYGYPYLTNVPRYVSIIGSLVRLHGYFTEGLGKAEEFMNLPLFAPFLLFLPPLLLFHHLFLIHLLLPYHTSYHYTTRQA